MSQENRTIKNEGSSGLQRSNEISLGTAVLDQPENTTDDTIKNETVKDGKIKIPPEIIIETTRRIEKAILKKLEEIKKGKVEKNITTQTTEEIELEKSLEETRKNGEEAKEEIFTQFPDNNLNYWKNFYLKDLTSESEYLRKRAEKKLNLINKVEEFLDKTEKQEIEFSMNVGENIVSFITPNDETIPLNPENEEWENPVLV